MKRKIVANSPFCHVTVLSVDMSNPMSVFYFAKRIRHIYRRVDVLYLNNSVVNIESMDWNVMYEALRNKSIGCLFTTGRFMCERAFIRRASEHGKYMITPVNLGTNDCGFGIEFCQQVLCPFILVPSPSLADS